MWESDVKIEHVTSGGKNYDVIISGPNTDSIKEDKKVVYFSRVGEEEKYDLFRDPLANDLIKVAIAVFSADKRIGRAYNSNRYGTRTIELQVPVFKLQKWKNVKDTLNKILSFITYDTIRLSFKQKQSQPSQKFDRLKPFSEDVDCVSLLSGGLDSFAGRIYLKSKNKNLKLVSIQHGKNKSVLDSVHEKTEIEPEYRFKINFPEKWVSEYTQFSRSFVYLCFGVIVAKELDVKDINIPESGIIATQIGLNEGRLVSRTVHPKFIKWFNQFIQSLFRDWNGTVKNPFRYKTKSEVVKVIIEDGKKEYVKDTRSCSHVIGHGNSACGMCMQCIMRNIALKYLGIRDGTKYSQNGIDPFNEVDLTDPKYPEKFEEYRGRYKSNLKRDFNDCVNFLFELLNLVNDLNSLTDEDLIIKYPEFIDQKLLKMYKRFGKEVSSVLENSKVENNRELLNKM